ncbi:MAG: PTS fructose transporter subunit IIA [Solobacterium sp.]|nr:PTS fructose transporter subunit IIA [Solobacterium sp.]
MRYVVLVSHGDFAPGLRSAVFMMTGPKDEVLCTNLRADMSADQFQDNFRELVAPIGDEDEVILLCDILGGSPMTKSLEVLSERGLLERSIVITGMNMPMAMTAVIMKDALEDKEMLKSTIISEAQNAVAEFQTAVDDADADDDI